MKSLLALGVTVFTACAIAHPGVHSSGNQHGIRAHPGPLSLTNDDLSEPLKPLEMSDPIGREPVYSRYPSYLVSAGQFQGQKRIRVPYPPPPPVPTLNLLNEEIDRLGNMADKFSILYKPESPWKKNKYERIIGAFMPSHPKPNLNYKYPPKPVPSHILITAAAIPRKHPIRYRPVETTTLEQVRTYDDIQKERKSFALTPMDEEYFIPTENTNSYNRSTSFSEGPHEGGGKKTPDEVDRRQIRQNPNLSRTKTLVAEDLNKLRQGVSSDNMGSTVTPTHIRVFGTDFRRESVYSVGVAAGVATALILAISAFTAGWYIIAKRAKAAADVEYPAYGVTGPTSETSGDRRLAHSAQMYHYQHQKQQIIAMERNTAEQRTGSQSDLESEDDNEEGDYTVYECPGFATTGEMEVRNPLFDDPTPATPGRIQVVQPQPKE